MYAKLVIGITKKAELRAEVVKQRKRPYLKKCEAPIRIKPKMYNFPFILFLCLHYRVNTEVTYLWVTENYIA